MDTMSNQTTWNSTMNESFRKGFARGFSAPFLFFSPIEIRRPSKFNGSVAKAWADVGRALDEATRRQGATIEQKPRSKTAARHRRNKAA
jgi:hypothetical protein